MASNYFQINGIEELQDDIKKLLRQYPSETEQELEKLATDFQKDVNKKFPHGGKSGQTPVAKKWKRYKLKDGLNGLTVGVSLQNTAPHFHLVENGHKQIVNKERYAALMSGQLIFSGQKNQNRRRSAKSKDMVQIGFVQGKHHCEKTRNEWNNGEFAARVEKHVDKLLKKHNL